VNLDDPVARWYLVVKAQALVALVSIEIPGTEIWLVATRLSIRMLGQIVLRLCHEDEKLIGQKWEQMVLAKLVVAANPSHLVGVQMPMKVRLAVQEHYLCYPTVEKAVAAEASL